MNEQVLIVIADYSPIAEMLRNIFSKYIEAHLPVKVDTAKTEDEAIQKIKAGKDLAAVLINLNGFLGEELYRMIYAAQHKRPHPMVIAATAVQPKIPAHMFDRIWNKGSNQDLLSFIKEKLPKSE